MLRFLPGIVFFCAFLFVLNLFLQILRENKGDISEFTATKWMGLLACSLCFSVFFTCQELVKIYFDNKNENTTAIVETYNEKKDNCKNYESYNMSITDVKKIFSEKGFDECSLYAEYSPSGKNLSSYQINYLSSNGNMWIITYKDGLLLANPVFYNSNSKNIQIILTETEDISKSYDSKENVCKINNNVSKIVFKVVDEINANTLDKLSIEDIAKT